MLADAGGNAARARIYGIKQPLPGQRRRAMVAWPSRRYGKCHIIHQAGRKECCLRLRDIHSSDIALRALARIDGHYHGSEKMSHT